MFRQAFTDFFFATNTDGSGKTESYVRALDMLGPIMVWDGEIIRFSIACGLILMVLSSGAIGHKPDPEKYNRSLRNVVESRCKDFEKLGIVIDPASLQYGEEEIIDSFLNGREFYRTQSKKRIPLNEKLDWLKGYFGNAYEGLYKAWSHAVENRKAGVSPRWTLDRIRSRLDELAARPTSPVKMDSGMCRSTSSGAVARIDYRCIHCGRHTVYTGANEVYHNPSPEYYKRVADEIKEWGLDVEVDGRSACPDCCKEPRDFKLSMTPEICRVKPDAAPANNNRPSIMPGIDLKVVGLRKRWDRKTKVLSYKVQCVLPEAWVAKDQGQYIVYAGTNDLYGIVFLGDDEALEYAEPYVTSGIFTKIVNFPCSRVEVSAKRVEAVMSVRSSELDNIPPTFFVINGNRFAVDEFTANALLAFVQGYTTFISGPFCDHYPIQPALSRLRDCLGVSKE